MDGVEGEIQCRQYLDQANKIGRNYSRISYSVDLQGFGEMLSAHLADLIGREVEFSEDLNGKCFLRSSEPMTLLTVLLRSASLRYCTPRSRSSLFSRLSTVRLCWQRHTHKKDRKDSLRPYRMRSQGIAEITSTHESDLNARNIKNGQSLNPRNRFSASKYFSSEQSTDTIYFQHLTKVLYAEIPNRIGWYVQCCEGLSMRRVCVWDESNRLHTDNVMF